MKQMIRLKLLLSCVLMLNAFAFAQERKAPMLLQNFGEKAEVTTMFTSDLKTLLRQLKDSPKTSSIFLAVATGNLESDLRVRQKARELFTELGFSPEQFYISHPLTTYWPKVTKTQLWLVSKDTQVPYAVWGIQDSCISGTNTSRIAGLMEVDPKTERLFFSATVSEQWPSAFIDYKWSVTNGIIEDGQGTSKISVRAVTKTEVRVSLKADLIDWPCGSILGAEFTTWFRSE